MSKEYLKSIIDCVSGIEVKSEAEQIAKYELIEYVEDLQQRIDKAKDLSDEIYNFIKCRNSNLFYEIEDLLIKQDKILGGDADDE